MLNCKNLSLKLKKKKVNFVKNNHIVGNVLDISNKQIYIYHNLTPSFDYNYGLNWKFGTLLL